MRMYTVEEVAELLNVKTVLLRRWLREGRFSGAIKAGRLWRIPEEAYNSFLARGEEEARGENQ